MIETVGQYQNGFAGGRTGSIDASSSSGDESEPLTSD